MNELLFSILFLPFSYSVNIILQDKKDKENIMQRKHIRVDWSIEKKSLKSHHKIH